MARIRNGCRTILAGRDRFCHMAVVSYNLEDTEMTPSARSARLDRAAHLDRSTDLDRSARLDSSAPRFDRTARFDGASRLEPSLRTRRGRPFATDPRTPAAAARPVARREPVASRADCAVCGSPDIAADEALHNGLWLLGECGRCGHRWTAGPFDGPLPAPASLQPVSAAFDEDDLEAPHAA